MDIQVETIRGTTKANEFMKTVKVVSVQAQTMVIANQLYHFYHITYEQGS